MAWTAYPYSGVQFAYYLPSQEDVNKQLTDLKEVKNYLSSLHLNPEKYYYFYPLYEEEDEKEYNKKVEIHNKLLFLIKVYQFVKRGEVNDFSQKLLEEFKDLTNLYPGDPHTLNDVLVTGEWSGYNETTKPKYLKLNPILDFKQISPLEEDPTTGLVYIFTEKAQEHGLSASDFHYCGDMQAAWEIAQNNNEAGNFKTCRSNRTKKVITGDTLEDIEKLFREPPVITTLKMEIKALDQFIARNTKELETLTKTLEDKRYHLFESPDRKRAQQLADDLEQKIQTKSKELLTKQTKRRRAAEEVKELQNTQNVRRRVEEESKELVPYVD